jgi:hypothetical protein
MRVVFLDFDGVVNTPWWEVKDGKLVSCFAFPEDGKVNNWQAVQWVCDFCSKYGYKVVISSTWRTDGLDTCIRCLKNGGWWDSVEIVGATPVLHTDRGDEISAWLYEHPEVKEYLIFDDDEDMTVHMNRLVKCRTSAGFLLDEYLLAESLHKAFNNHSSRGVVWHSHSQIIAEN